METETPKGSKKRKSSVLERGSSQSKISNPLKETMKMLNPILKKIKLTDDSDSKKTKKSTSTSKPKKKAEEKKERSATPKKKDAAPKKKRSNFRRMSKADKEAARKEAKENKEPAVTREIKVEEAITGLPFWVLPQYRQDREGRKMSDKGYDPTTLLIPGKEYYKLPKLHRKYWKFKSRYFDKMVAVKMWSAYFFYGTDAIIIHKLFDTKLNELQGRVFTQFPECMLVKYAPKLLENDHKIVVVEKVKKNLKKDNDKTTKGVIQVITRGTYADNLEIGYFSQFCLCIFERNLRFGLVYFDATTHEFFAGEFKDDMYRANLRTLITKIKPVEIVYMPEYLQKETIHMLKALPTHPMMSPMSGKQGQIPSVASILKKFSKYFNSKAGATKPVLPKLLADIKTVLQNHLKSNDDDDNDNDNVAENNNVEIGREEFYPFFLTLQSLQLCITHLENVLLAETTFVMGSFFELDIELEKKSSLYLDSQALENLEILDIGYLSTIGGDYSLFGYMDKTVSAFGKRMFRRWVTSPLYDPLTINDRLDAVQELVSNYELVEYFQKEIKSIPDLERIINRTYTVANKKKAPASYFEDLAKSRMGDFIGLLSELEKVEPIIEKMGASLANSTSKRLKQLTKVKEVNVKAFELKQLDYKVYSSKNEGMFPKISHLISDLKEMMQPRNGMLLPAPGLSEDCDIVIATIDALKEDLMDILEDQRKHFKDNSLKYVHTKHRYEIEIPESVLERTEKPMEFVVTSKKKGFMRFHTPAIEKYLKDLEDLEDRLTKALIVFVVAYFKKFYERKAYWNQVVMCLAELDCLCGLATLAAEMKTSCRPVLVLGDQNQHFELRDMIHPCVARHNKDFVPNDLVVEDKKNIFLITGPNMGGKSTFLRQACIAIIMAQVGSFVPASYLQFNPVDRIFTRIGASDRLIEGKSTFFIEMEETYHILTEATRSSLLVVDELGRGTSTYDGVSIAYAAMKYIAEKLRCLTLFATHYHLLIEEFKLYKNIDTYCMESEFNAEREELKFKYKFIKGHETSSFGIMIAKMAGIPKNVLQVAKAKAATMTKEKKNVDLERGLTKKFNSMIELVGKVEDLRLMKVGDLLDDLEFASS